MGCCNHTASSCFVMLAVIVITKSLVVLHSGFMFWGKLRTLLGSYCYSSVGTCLHYGEGCLNFYLSYIFKSTNQVALQGVGHCFVATRQ